MRTTLALSIAVIALLLTAGTTPVAHANDGTRPYGDRITERIANHLHGRDRDGMITSQPSVHAEEVNALGHVFAIMHTPSYGAMVRRRGIEIYEGECFAQHRRRFVIPLTSRYDTTGGLGLYFSRATRHAARVLGPKWHVYC